VKNIYRLERKKKRQIGCIINSDMQKFIVKEKRALLVVNCLAEHGDRRLLYLYRFIEKAGIGVAAHFLSSQYGLFSVLKDREAGADLFFHRLLCVTGTPGIEAVDLFLQLHGRNKKVRFFDRWLDTMTLSHEIRRITVPGKLRLFYNLCCYGDSHSADMLAAGFKVTVGSRKINASAAVEYPLFCRYWSGDVLFSRKSVAVREAVRRADRRTVRQIQDRLAGRYFRNVDSKKITRGDGRITIDTL
jgi:hypothetical protein